MEQELSSESVMLPQNRTKDTIEKTLRDIEEIKNEYNLSLEEKHLQKSAEVTFFYDQDQTLFPKPIGKVTRTLIEENFFVLKPNPILRLERTIGIHPQYNSSQIFFNRDAKLSREILYTQANLLLGYQHSKQKQRLFFDHPTTTIEHLHVDGNYAFTATRSSENGEAKDFQISIWDVQEAKLVFVFKPPLLSIHSLTLNEQVSNESSYLCLSGRDFQKRDVILIYNFFEMLHSKRVEIYARQLCDFDLVNIRFNDAVPTALVACGRENIRFFKIKNGHLPGQSVTLNNTGRGKLFTRSLVDFTISDKGVKKPTLVYITTTCGLLYIVNYGSRQIEKIIQIHEEKVTALMISPTRNFIATASVNGLLRLWSPDFSKLISEVNTQQAILSCDLNHKEIAVLGAGGVVSILDMEESTFNVIIRSHQDNVMDMCFNKPGGKVVSVGLDQKIYIWNQETMEVITEFTTQNDQATKLASSLHDPHVAIGFHSGFIRIFDLSFENSGKLVAETMIFDSPVMDLQYSPDNKFLAVFYKSCRIVIFSIEKGYQPVKNIDYEFPNEYYFSLSFSPDDKYLANISSNANNVTVWETKNFSLKFHLDLTGDIISKVQFAPNGKDLVLLTTSSKLKFYRISFNELKFSKEIYGVTDLECLDFSISPNCRFLACCGKEGVVRIYDYFMRGAAVPNYQGFIGHFKWPKKVYWQDDMRFLFTIGDGNGIFRWTFFGDKEAPSDISSHFEELQVAVKSQTKQDETVFDHEDLLRMTHDQIDQQYQALSNHFTQQEISQPQPIASQENIMTIKSTQQMPQIQYNTGNYRFEQYDIELKKVLQCSIGNGIKNNLVWHKENRYIAYTSQNIVIVEDLNQEKTQRLLKEGNDKIYSLKLSPNNKFLLAFTQRGDLDGFPQLYIWDASTLKKLNHISIPDEQLTAVYFSPLSNMLLVLSKSFNTNSEENIISQIAIWDFLDGHKDIFCKSHIPMNIKDGRWNQYLGDSTEFVTITDKKYHYWKINNNLTLQYQEGDIPKKRDLFSSKDDVFTTCEFFFPTLEQLSIYMALGLSNGYIWITDSRCNQFLYNVKVLDGPVRHIMTTQSKIIIEGSQDCLIHCWQLGPNGQSDPQAFFNAKEQTLQLDGFPQASSYEENCNESVVSTSSGTLWFLSWTELATIKLKSCHSPNYPISSSDFKYLPPGQFQIESDATIHQFDQNYMIASSGKDGVIKLWNMYDSEFLLQFIVPKEECVAICMHQFKPFMIASFTDGFLRFFEIQNKSKTLGRCQISSTEADISDYLISIKILPSGNHILGASKNGQIILIYIQSWDPLAIKIEQLASINTSLHSFDVSFLEPYNKWLVGTSNGKVIVYNRKDFNAYQQEIFDEANPPRFNFMDAFNLLDYVDNSFTESKRCNTLDHYYSVAKRNLVQNEVDIAHLCDGVFSNGDLTLHISFIAKACNIFVRNFELHQVVRRIDLQALPLQITLTPSSSFFIVLQKDNVLKMIDLVNTENTSEIETIHEQATSLKMCPNGRYILTGGNQGDICIWNIVKKRDEIVE